MARRATSGGKSNSYTRASLARELSLLLQRLRRREGSVAVGSIAAMIKVSQATLYNYLNGTTLPPVDTLDDLLSVLQATPTERKELQELRDDLAVRRDLRRGPGQPVIEVAHGDEVEIANIEGTHEVSPEDYNLAGPFEIIELDEHIDVDELRNPSRVLFRRTIRATAPGLRRFLYAFECPPDSGLRRVVVDPRGTVRVPRVIQVGEGSYVFHLEFADALAVDEPHSFEFAITTVENRNREPRGIYGKRQFVTTRVVRLSVGFSPKAHPHRVRWFAAPFPIGHFPDGYSFPEGNVLPQGEDGRYSNTFDQDALAPERIVGLVWDYE
ncbi:helix-turn-helix domain-containing protein [Micromonospora gifhornensis]|uniref:helix-turn-helix domain-containing protein n=1 Tax=Micromonospora gifhornensis TaxID=84594 RepID=UPI003D732B10